MIERFIVDEIDNESVKKEHTLQEDISIYSEALKETEFGITELLNGDIKAAIHMEYLLDYYLKAAQKDEQFLCQLAQLKDILDRHTQVQYSGRKAYNNRGGRFVYEFCKFELPKDIKQELSKTYKQVKSSLKNEKDQDLGREL